MRSPARRGRTPLACRHRSRARPARPARAASSTSATRSRSLCACIESRREASQAKAGKQLACVARVLAAHDIRLLQRGGSPRARGRRCCRSGSRRPTSSPAPWSPPVTLDLEGRHRDELPFARRRRPPPRARLCLPGAEVPTRYGGMVVWYRGHEGHRSRTRHRSRIASRSCAPTRVA